MDNSGMTIISVSICCIIPGLAFAAGFFLGKKGNPFRPGYFSTKKRGPVDTNSLYGD
jgi:hypothetical protein